MRKIKPKKTQSSSALLVASDDDLLLQILSHLPAKSLLQFKCVSKHFLSLITSPYFSKLRIRHPIPASGLILHRSSLFINPNHEFVPFDTKNPANPPFTKLTFTNDSSGIRILQSCNGLLFCCSFRCNEPSREYYIYNPTTKQFATLPKPGETTPASYIAGIILAYDPSKSTRYKVICVKGYATSHSSKCQIEIYSSEDRKWRVSGKIFKAHYDINFKNGVYWNGAIHWICGRKHSIYFKIDQEKVEKMPMPLKYSNWDETRIEYFGESCDRFHLIEVNSRQATLFNVYEMERDRTRWLLKYNVDLDSIVTAFPSMIRDYLPTTDYHHYAMFVLNLIRREKDEDSFMVLHIPDKAIRYNLVDKSFYELCDFTPDYPQMMEEDGINNISLQFHWSSGFQYIESHCIF